MQRTHRNTMLRLMVVLAIAMVTLLSSFVSPLASIANAGEVSSPQIGTAGSTAKAPDSNNKILAATPVNLHQIKTWYYGVVNGNKRYKMRIKNLGGTATSPFTYWFDVNVSWRIGYFTQNNPIKPGLYVDFYCDVPINYNLTSVEMSSNLYYIAPDDITP